VNRHFLIKCPTLRRRRRERSSGFGVWGEVGKEVSGVMALLSKHLWNAAGQGWTVWAAVMRRVPQTRFGSVYILVLWRCLPLVLLLLF
jgi:hypothetical protein